jgi:hypothetical protein
MHVSRRTRLCARLPSDRPGAGSAPATALLRLYLAAARGSEAFGPPHPVHAARAEGVATGSEWRTPPLWGIGLTQTVGGHTLFLHDGRARSITEAILWLRGEGQASRDAFGKLSKADRDRLVAFVNSL